MRLPVNPRGHAMRQFLRFVHVLPPHTERDFVLEMMPKRSVCAEIGVWRGDFSQRIVRIVQPRELHLIDPWRFAAEFPTRLYGGAAARSQADMDAIHAAVVRRFRHSASVVIHRTTSIPQAASFAAESFDWVYIDGDHSYEAVLADLNAYLRVVRTGGFLAGDDLNWNPENDCPVKRAVDEFIASGAVELVTARDSQFILRKRAR